MPVKEGLAGSPLLLPKLYSTEYWAWAEVAARTTISRAKSRYVCIFRMVPILRFRVQNCQRLDPTRSGLGSQRRGERCKTGRRKCPPGLAGSQQEHCASNIHVAASTRPRERFLLDRWMLLLWQKGRFCYRL